MADYTTYMYILYIFMVYTLLGYTTGLDITVCKNGGNFPSVILTCSTNNDMIHVENITYFYNQGPDCGSSTVPCGPPLTNSDTGLISSCTGQPSPCQQYIPNYSNCTGSTVNYRCIPRENDQHMCQRKLKLTENAGSLFLFSPNYPAATSSFEPHETSCKCFIRSTSITSITILDLRLQTSSDGTRSSLFIQYGDIAYNKTSRENSQSTLQVYNHILPETPLPTSADIIFTHQQINGLKLWIEIQGLSLAGSCNNIPVPTPTTPFTTPPLPDSTTTPGTSPPSTSTATHTSTDSSTSSETSSVHPTTVNNTDSSTTIHPSTSSDRSTDTSERSNPATNPSDSAAQETDKDKDIIIIIVLATILPLSVALVIVLFLMHRKGKLKCLNQPSNPGTENSRTITPPEPATTYSNLSDTDRNNTDNAYQELQTRNSNSPYNNLPYSDTDIESGTNYSSLSDSNRLDTDNNNYQQLQTRTPTSPYSNLPYTSEHHTYSN